MSHKLTDITLYYYPEGDEALRFTKRQNVVSGLYVHFLDGYKPKRTSRISVELSDEDYVKEHFETSILGATAEFDKEKYWSLNEKGQNKFILDTVHRMAVLCSQKYNWDEGIFYDAYDKVIEANYKFDVELKRKFSRNRKNKGAIIISTYVEYCSLNAVFYDKDESEINRVELLKTYQHEMFYGELIRNYKWFGNDEFGIQSRHGHVVIKAGIDSKEPEMIISPSELMSRETIEEYMDTITYTEDQEVE